MKKRTLEKGELGFLAALGIFSAAAFVGSLQLFLQAPTLNGEGTVPLITSLVLLCMTGIMLRETRGCPKGFAKGTALGQRARELLSFLFPGAVGVIIVYCLVYAVLLSVAGFAVSTFLFLVCSILTLNREHKVRTLLISAITLVCIMLLFQYLFKVHLP